MNQTKRELKLSPKNFYDNQLQHNDTYKAQLMMLLRVLGFTSFSEAMSHYPCLNPHSYYFNKNNKINNDSVYTINMSIYNGPSTLYKYMQQAFNENKYEVFCDLSNTYVTI